MCKVMAAATMAAALALGPGSAEAGGQLNVICSAEVAWCELMEKAFEKESGVEVSMVRLSSGEAYAKIRAEAGNPKTDLWWGGTGDPHLQAAQEGLTQEYRSRQFGELHDWAQRQAEGAGFRTVGIYAGALGFGYNTELQARNGLPTPKCWKDLAAEAYRGEIQIANPNSSGTAYTALATLVQLFGEDEAFALLERIGRNVSQYTKSGSAPVKAAARGETTIGVVFLHDAVAQRVEGFPIEAVAPCEGTGYEVGSMSIVAGAPNLDNARQWYDFALRADVQSMAKDVKSYQVPSNRAAALPPEAPRLADIKLIDYDFKIYGNAETRRRLLVRWDQEIGSDGK
ncbi:ABC transporter substrate-binding protein [Inquilinus sp. OTU3971]|uniref:ABC transporter substrate-binding protein n=1 Tax=Inquilinus sp. OTU3971 TaxID=3043855 RepID=UPI00313D5B20